MESLIYRVLPRDIPGHVRKGFVCLFCFRCVQETRPFLRAAVDKKKNQRNRKRKKYIYKERDGEKKTGEIKEQTKAVKTAARATRSRSDDHTHEIKISSTVPHPPTRTKNTTKNTTKTKEMVGIWKRGER